MVGIAPTGSGKTFAYAVPMLVSCLCISTERRRRGEPQAATALVLLPTRELAVQTHDVLAEMAEQCAPRLRVSLALGGVGMTEALGASDSRENPGAGMPSLLASDVIVATPARLLQLLTGPASRSRLLRGCAYLVLDEADVLFDTGFRRQTESIVGLCPPNCQKLFLSATFSGELRRYLLNVFSRLMRGLAPFSLLGSAQAGPKCGPVQRWPSNDIVVCTVGSMLFPSPNVSHAFVDVTEVCGGPRDILPLPQFTEKEIQALASRAGHDGRYPLSPPPDQGGQVCADPLPSFESLLASSAGEPGAAAAEWTRCLNEQLRPLLDGAEAISPGSPPSKSKPRLLHRLLVRYFAARPFGRVMVFLNSQDGVEGLWAKLEEYEARRASSRRVSFSKFYSGLEQQARLVEVGRYRSGAADVLITSGGCGRGLDIPQTSLVINYDCPSSPEDYLHQTGRTGRGYASGFAMTLVNLHTDLRAITAIREALPILDQRLTVKSDETSRRCAFYADSMSFLSRIPPSNTQHPRRAPVASDPPPFT